MNVLHKLSSYLYKRCAHSGKKGDHRGLSLVELVCAIAIMGLVGAGVSGFMIVGANTYRSGTTEVELQTEAQMVVNQIGDLVIDSTAVIKGYDASGAEVKEDATTIIIDSTGKHYEISHAGDTGNDDTAYKVFYSEYNVLADGTLVAFPNDSSNTQLMAENVTEFKSDIRDFESGGILRLYMRLEKDNRVYAAYYTITARNGSYTVEDIEVAPVAATVVAPYEIVVEPNQDYPLSATVVGGISNTAVTWSLAGNLDGATQVIQEADGWHLHVGKGESSNNMKLTVSTAVMNGTEPLAQTTVKVNLRRVNELELYGVLISGESMKAGAVYRISPKFVGSNLDRFLGLETPYTGGSPEPDDYVDPYAFNWLPLEVTGANAGDFKLDTSHGTYAELTLLDDFEIGEVTVSARALHPDGMVSGAYKNRSGDPYTTTGVIGEWTLKPTSGWLRGGESPVLSEVLEDFDVEGRVWPSVVYYLDWERMYVPGGEYDSQLIQQSSNDNVRMSDGRGRMVTWAGIITIFDPNNMADLREGLVRSWYSYSSPYYDLDMGYPDSIYKLRLHLRADVWTETGQTHHETTMEFEIPDVTISYRNSNPTDNNGAWSNDTGSHVVYITDEDDIDTYTSYFMLVNGWISEGVTYDLAVPGDHDHSSVDWDNPINYNDYILFNRFVGVIEDNAGVENDKRYDLTFVGADNKMYKNGLVPYMEYVTWENGHGVYNPITYRYKLIQEIGVTKDELLTRMSEWSQYTSNATNESYNYANLVDRNLKTSVISSGDNGQCTIAVFVTQDEKDMLCADGGTTITEKYEYNPMFCTNDLYLWSTGSWEQVKAERAESVDGCLGYLEYRFRESNIVLGGSSVKPKVMYCPLASDTALVKGYYYIDEDTRYKVSGAVAEYQTKPHGAGSSAFATQLWLDLNADGKWHAR